MNWMLLVGKKQTRKPYGFIQQWEEGSAVPGFTQDIADPSTASFHRWAETVSEGGEGCRCLTAGLAWYSLAQDMPPWAFMLWRKGGMAQIGVSHPRASQSCYTAGLGHASHPLHWASASPFTATCERFQHLAGSHLVFLLLYLSACLVRH